MHILSQVDLKDFVTMRLGGPAHAMAEVKSVADVEQAVAYAKDHDLPIYVLGGGSNTVVHDEGSAGLVILNQIAGFEVIDQSTSSTTIKIGAGEDWDKVVERSVAMNLSGIECLSAIPGTAGAAPVQNIGAYGQEVAETIVSLSAYDTLNDRLVTLQGADCQFGYRDSMFRNSALGRYIITDITLKLNKSAPQPPFYAAVQNYLDSHQIIKPSVADLRAVVTAIRADRLPDPKQRPNTGSFFKNAVVDHAKYAQLQAAYSDIPSYDMPDGQHKIPTGWLIEQAGFKGQLMHGIRVHDKNALVLINESATSYRDLAAARQEIIAGVRQKFDIAIDQEPLEI